MVKIVDCEKLSNPPVGLADIPEDDSDLFNVNIDFMQKEQWYKFEGNYGTPVYIQLTNENILIQTFEKPDRNGNFSSKSKRQNHEQVKQ